MLPVAIIVPPPVNVAVDPVVVKLWQTAVDELIVMVPPPLLALKTTSSAVVGTLAPPAPPDVADQCVVSVPSQVPDPPTQNRDATISPRYRPGCSPARRGSRSAPRGNAPAARARRSPTGGPPPAPA